MKLQVKGLFTGAKYSNKMINATTITTTTTITSTASTTTSTTTSSSSSSSTSYMALQPISGLGFLFMRFRNLTLIDNW
jgi:hypothetical protein